MGTARSGRGAPVYVTGGGFTFRTLHAPSEQRGRARSSQITLDKEITFMMPAVSGFRHRIVPTVRIKL